MFTKIFTHKWVKWILIVIGVFAVFWVVYFYLTFFTDFWRFYPEPYRFQAAFYRLNKSCIELPYGGMCKGSCGYERERYRREIADYLNKDNANIAQSQVKRDILNEKNTDCFRIELVDSLYMSQEQKNPNKKTINPPQYIIDYLSSQKGYNEAGANLVTQEILDLYGKSAFSGDVFQKLLKKVQDPKTSCDDKYHSIENLGRYGDGNITRPIFQKMIEENKDPDHLWISYWAAKALGAPNKKDRKFVKWCEGIIWGDYNEYVKEEIVGSLSDYKNNVPKEKKYILNIFKKIYFDKSQSKFLRNDVAYILQYNLGKGSEKMYPNIKIPNEEGDKHYNSCPTCVDFCPALNKELVE